MTVSYKRKIPVFNIHNHKRRKLCNCPNDTNPLLNHRLSTDNTVEYCEVGINTDEFSTFPELVQVRRPSPVLHYILNIILALTITSLLLYYNC
jgi:hypothetical protein